MDDWVSVASCVSHYSPAMVEEASWISADTLGMAPVLVTWERDSRRICGVEDTGQEPREVGDSREEIWIYQIQLGGGGGVGRAK